MTQKFKLNTGLKLGYTLSPLQFNIYFDNILKGWFRDCLQYGTTVRDEVLNSLLFDDDMIIFAESREYRIKQKI